jgi:serine/threonine protein kinase
VVVEQHAPELRALGYELLEILGTGGMGQVWRARDLRLARDVAIKFINGAMHGAQARERFEVEARSLARVTHPNVVSVYQLGEFDGHPFLVYEIVEGVGLDRLIGDLTWQRALAIALDLARGLAAVHQAGVLHRDLKPANAMLTLDGIAKLIDFGVAKLDGELIDQAFDLSSSESRTLTEPLEDRADQTEEIAEDMLAPSMQQGSTCGITLTNTLLGTPRYIAPEMWLGKPASPVSDVYTLGLITWEMLTGTQAYQSVPGTDLMRAIVDTPLPSIAELCPDVPEEFGAIVDRAVSKRPLDRFQTAAEFGDALQRMTWHLRAPMRPPATRWIRTGELSIAMQRFGDGPLDLVFIPAWVSHCEAAWRLPAYATFMHQLGRLARVTVFDKRGTGMSDRINASIPIEERMLDIGVLLDALRIDSAVLLGVQDGGAIASMYAASQPDRVRGLIWYAAARRLLIADDYPFGMPAPMFSEVCAAVEPNWGAPLFAEFVAPSRVHDPEYLAWWADYLRNGASPSTAKWMLELNAKIDVAPLLPAIGVPTLVVHRRHDRMLPLPGGKLVADGIVGSRWVELDGEDHQPWLSDTAALLTELGNFLAVVDDLPRHQRRLLSLLARPGQIQTCTGPADAMRRALDAKFDSPALVHAGSTITNPEQVARRLIDLIQQLDSVSAGTVLATADAVSLAAGAQLKFERFEAGMGETLFEVRRA